MKSLGRRGVLAACALGLVLGSARPAAAQADFTRFVVLGDSIMAGYLDGCIARHGQLDSIGAVIARQAGADFQQPIVAEPGLGGCLVLTSLAPTFTRRPSANPLDPATLPNRNLPRAYNNLAVPGFKVKDVTDARSSADNGNPLTDVVLRGQGATALQQAASLTPTFLLVFIGNNDVLGALTSGTAIEGATLTPMSVIEPRIQQIVTTMRAAQGGTGKGIWVTVPDVAALPFASTIPPFITSGGQPVINPATNQPFTFLSRRVVKDRTIPTGQIEALAPIPANSLITLAASAFLAQGYGIPCAVLNAGGAPANDPRRLHCNEGLPDDANPQAGTPGVVLYPDEVASIRARTAQINATIDFFARPAGYKIFDGGALFEDLRVNGRHFAGVDIRTAFLSGGFFSYDGVHPNSIGYTIVADELIQFINANYGTSIPRPDMFTVLFDGNSSGGVPLGLAMTGDEKVLYAAQIFTRENFRAMQWALQLLPARAELPVGNGGAGVERHERDGSPRGERHDN